MAASQTKELGKMDFAEQYLEQHPDANVVAVNDAWRAAGRDGTISKSAVGKLRAKLGLTDPYRNRGRSESASTPAKKTATKPRATAGSGHRQRNGEGKGMRKGMGHGHRHDAVPEPARAATHSRRAQVIEQIEAEVDRILFQVMALGDLTEVEDALRRGRRLLILAARP